VLDHLTISIITHRRTYRNFHHNISDFINAEDSQISINRAMCGHLDAYETRPQSEGDARAPLTIRAAADADLHAPGINRIRPVKLSITHNF